MYDVRFEPVFIERVLHHGAADEAATRGCQLFPLLGCIGCTHKDRIMEKTGQANVRITGDIKKLLVILTETGAAGLIIFTEYNSFSCNKKEKVQDFTKFSLVSHGQLNEFCDY